ncbi:MAG TPA: hypothetical protein ENJ52_08555 [Aliiroseovarius sp.]|nr:hypothetical protein [Aliiroseovarius sp.]
MSGKSIKDKLVGNLPELKIPTLMRDVEIPVYLVHNSTDPEDYFFIIDFEAFADFSVKGSFVRPKLNIWAGRDDFSRTEFAKHFREVFAGEFDRMRAAILQKENRKSGLGWFNWADAITLDPAFIGRAMGHMVLTVALVGGKAVLGSMPFPKWAKRASALTRQEEEISETKTAVEAALRSVDVTLHPELYKHAYRGALLGKNADLDREAWPLPAHVRQHLAEGKSGSWW